MKETKKNESLKTICTQSIGAFAQFIEPEFKRPSHIQTILKALFKIHTGEMKRLIVTLPPRHGKSMLISKLFPAWYLANNPNTNLIFSTYGQELADDFGRYVRNVYMQDSFNHIFPNIKLSQDSSSAKKFSLNNNSTYFAVGAGGPITGRGGDCVVKETMILTHIGYYTIEEICKDFEKYKVYSFDHNNRRFRYKPINAYVKKNVSRLLHIETESGRELKCTYEHKILKANYQYVEAGFLIVGDRICIINENHNLKFDKIKSIEKMFGEFDVYDIEVDNLHNYIANHIIVHNCIIIDDIIKNRQDANSPTIKKNIIDWYNSTLYTRLSPNGRLVIVNTRWAEDDLVGYLLNKEPDQWNVINMPAISEEGTALWPERWGIEKLNQIKSSIGSFEFASLYQQTPVPSEGAIIKKEWIRTYRELPYVKNYSWSWDTAIKVGQENDYSVGQLWAECENGYYLVDMVREKLEYPDLRRAVQSLYNKYKSSEIIIEDKASGQQVIQDLKRMGNLPVIGVIPGKQMPTTKLERMQLVSPIFEAGKVFIPEVEKWSWDFIHEMVIFPQGKHDDICDATTQYLARKINFASKIPNIRML